MDKRRVHHVSRLSIVSAGDVRAAPAMSQEIYCAPAR